MNSNPLLLSSSIPLGTDKEVRIIEREMNAKKYPFLNNTEAQKQLLAYPRISREGSSGLGVSATDSTAGMVTGSLSTFRRHIVVL